MRVDLFGFDLPPALIAQVAIEPRDAARLLHVAHENSDYHVHDLPNFLHAGDVLVFNNSKVIPARLFAEVNNKSIECFLHKRLTVNEEEVWLCFARPARKLNIGMQLHFATDFSAKIIAKQEDGQLQLRFNVTGEDFMEKLHRHGHIPLPPYISRADTQDDAARYQTIYAKHEGSVAAPTAGLHFTPELLDRLTNDGVLLAYVTLHVGAGTFQPVKVDDTDAHQMHSEWVEVTQQTADIINQARLKGGKIIAVGTTSLRVLESVADEQGRLSAFVGDTDIFITPGYRFKLVDTLMTNFHLPRSTLFMLVCAFAGTARMKIAYKHAIDKGYRFYSYGDASLLERNNALY